MCVCNLQQSLEMASSEGPYYIGVDVGTSSVRAALISSSGMLINIATNPIKIYEPQLTYYEQSSEDIWLATCKVVRVCTISIYLHLSYCGICICSVCIIYVTPRIGMKLNPLFIILINICIVGQINVFLIHEVSHSPKIN